MSNVVVFSPSRFSLYTICFTELLRRSNVHVSAIVVRRLVSPTRFITEYRWARSRLFGKVWKKLILRKGAYENKEYDTIVDLMQREKISQKTVDEFNRRYGIPVVYCKSLNDSSVVQTLRQSDPDLVVFSGGGLIRKEVLAHCGDGILNCHPGVLPEYRGMDPLEWAIIEDKSDHVGASVLFIDEGVDTGDILSVTKMGVTPGEDLERLGNRMEPIICRQMVSTCIEYLNGNLQRQSQRPGDGKQYFLMHPRLAKIAEGKLRKCQTVSDKE